MPEEASTARRYAASPLPSFAAAAVHSMPSCVSPGVCVRRWRPSAAFAATSPAAARVRHCARSSPCDSLRIASNSGRERRPAAAGALGAGVLDHELRAFQAFLVVDLGADEVLVAHRVDEQLDAVLLHHGVVLVLRSEEHT